MNSMQLKDKLRNVSKDKGVDFNTLLRLYMYDRCIERLAISKYRDNFILKGGFYLSTLFGVENRTTMDIDAAFKKAKFDRETIEKMIKEIIAIKIDDNSKLSFLGIAPIRDEDEYGGFRVSIAIEFENVKEKFHIDVATGDPITPKEIRYKYLPLLGDYYIDLYAYNMETVLAEKLETVLSRVELNGRMRDFYDIYLIYTKEWPNINVDHLKNSIKRTFEKRGFHSNINDAMNLIKESDELKRRWTLYQKRFDYAKDINFDVITNYMETILNKVL